MRGLWLLFHFMGFSLWLGAGMATMVAGIAAKTYPPAERLAAYKLSGRIQSVLVAPGALVTAISGLALMRPFMSGSGMTGGLLVMIVAGFAGALLALFFSVPLAQRMGRLELDARGELPEALFALRKRQAVVASIAGGLAIVAMFGGTVFRY
jgi:hypothetical protein